MRLALSPAQVIAVETPQPRFFGGARSCNGKHGGAFRAMRPKYTPLVPSLIRGETFAKPVKINFVPSDVGFPEIGPFKIRVF